MRKMAEQYLKGMLGNDARFHTDQYESIQSILSGNKTLVVQKTGWGKSIVYFIATKILRENGKGLTILISPLLSLMRNQIEAARKIGLKAFTLNSSNEEDWDEIKEQILTDNCDILLVSPERLGKRDFQELLQGVTKGIGMFVIDEAHCISNWGHDFRLDYKKIVNIVKTLPSNVPILATTATASNRVVEDIASQIGFDLNIIRGPLTRESLQLQVVNLKSQAERLAWLAERIPNIDGSGIVYCSTTSDCRKVAKWLKNKNIDAHAYYGNVEGNSEYTREELEQMLLDDEIKVLVATDALGMGFDKPNLSFVIHYQKPGNLVAYYQQIGRAGRKLEKAHVVLLAGGEDDDEINEYFITSAFPTKKQMKIILELVENSRDGMKLTDVLKEINIGYKKAEQCLKFLELERLVYKEGSKFVRTPVKENISLESKKITELRMQELRIMNEFCLTNECYMEFIAKQLDDYSATSCNRCSNCIEKPILPITVSYKNVAKAIQFLKGEFLKIKPRKKWPAGGVPGFKGMIKNGLINEEGRALSQYGDAGWGKMVKEDRYINKEFREELVEASAHFILETWKPNPMPEWVTAVPSLRHPELVPLFAQRLAEKLELPYYDAIIKVEQSEEQKDMKNSAQQVENIIDSYDIAEGICSGNVLLIDDIMNSGWSFTVCGYYLKEAGSGLVYPFALSATGGGSDSD